MKQRKNTIKLSAFIAAFCIVIYLFAMVQAVTRFFLSVDQRKDLAAKEFANIKELAVSTGQYGFMNDRFVQTIHNSLLATQTLEALIITGAGSSYPFEKQKDSVIITVNNSPRFANKFGISNVVYYDSLPINNIRNVTIEAKASSFDYYEITKILKDTLLFILIGFGISFFTILIKLLAQKTTPRTESEVAAVAAGAHESYSNANYAETDAQTQTGMASSPAEPKGLYSPRSNIGWEEYTKDRLNAEIHRCASMEKDLAFVSIEFSNAMMDADFTKAAEEAVTILSSKDMLFENGQHGIYAILPGTNLDSAIAKSEKFVQRVMQNNPECEPNIGITSRSGRLLNADRLMLEASVALKKAKEDETTSIIAFKSDPEKYRDFISQNS